MRLYALLTAGSCAALLAGCAKKPKPAEKDALTSDPSLARVVSSLPRSTPTTTDSTKGPAQQGRSTPAGAGRVATTKRSGAALAGGGGASGGYAMTGDLVPVRPAGGTDVWLNATAPTGGTTENPVFTQSTRTILDTATVGIITTTASAPIPVLDPTMGVAQSAVGLGNMLNVGGLWGSNPYTGYSQVLPQAFGLGFEGYHQGFNQFDPLPTSPQGGHEIPPTWGPSGPSTWDPPAGGPGPDYPSGGPNGDNRHDGPNTFDSPHGPPVTATPEPGSVILLATGLVALIPVVRRRRRA